MERWQHLAPVILRVGLSVVVMWFGSQQFLNPGAWTSFLPAWTGSLPLSQITFIYLNAWLEVALGLLLLVGFYTRLTSLILALHLAGIAFTLGFNAIAVRDFGLMIGFLSLAFHGPHTWTLDKHLDKGLN